MSLTARLLIQYFTIALVLISINACGGADSGPGTTGSNDKTKPFVIDSFPITDVATTEITAIIKVTFSESIAAVNTDNISITAISSIGTLGEPLTFPQQNVLVLTSKDTVINVRLANAGIDLAPNTQYLVKVYGIEDYAGNVMKGTCQWLFATTGANLTIPNSGPCETVPGTLSFEYATTEVDEDISSGATTLTVIRTGGSDGAVSVFYETQDLSTTVGSDYKVTKGTLTFDDGDDTSKAIVIPIINDAKTENSEKFTVSLSQVSGGAILSSSVHTVTINDDDIPLEGKLTFSVNKSTVVENVMGGNVLVNVTRIGGSVGRVSVEYQTSSGTNTNAAVAGKDYTPKVNTLIFDAGITTQTISIPIIDDVEIETLETFLISLRNITGGATLGSPNIHIVTIADDEQAAGLINLSVIPKLKQLQFNWTPSKAGSIYNMYVNPDGASGFTKVIGSAIKGTSFTLNIGTHNLDWVKAKFIVEACIKTTCYTSNELVVTDQMLKTIGYFKPGNTSIGTNFGSSVALSDDGLTLAVGAPFESNKNFNIINNSNFPTPAENKNDAIDSGAVYIYVRDKVTSDWKLKSYIKPGNTGAGDNFGISVALNSDGTTLAVGADREDSNLTSIKSGSLPTAKTDNNNAIDAGAVYIFTYTASNVWQQQAYIKPTNTGAGDNFGHSVSLSNDGNLLAVGAYNEDSLVPGVVNSNTLPKPDLKELAASNVGAAYVFSRAVISNVPSWSQQSYMKSEAQFAAAAGDFFGYSVALSGNGKRLVVGAYGKDFSTILNIGVVFVFTNNGAGSWLNEKSLMNFRGAADYNFGQSVAINDSGNVIIIGIPNASANTSIKIGLINVFILTAEGTWPIGDAFIANKSDTGDLFGASVSISGDGLVFAVGSPGEAGDLKGLNPVSTNFASKSGAVYIFKRQSTTSARFDITQKAYVKASNTDVNDNFGNSVALSVDGSTLAVGAPNEEGDTTGVSNRDITSDTLNKAPRTAKGFGAGAVYLY
ncbi:MAG: Calx-beta domain-containing protein [Gammaproteobacteria bacterium]